MDAKQAVAPTWQAERAKGNAPKLHFREIIDIIMGTMIKRRAMGKEYGIVVLAEASTIKRCPEGLERLASRNSGSTRSSSRTKALIC